MASITLSHNFVLKMKDLPGGITPEIDKIRADFGIDVNFDGKETVKLIHKNEDFLNIAIKTLQQRYNMDVSDSDIDGEISNQHVIWEIRYERAWKIVKLCRKELDQLKKKGGDVKFTQDKIKELPDAISITCKIKDFDEVNKILKGIKESSEKIEPLCVHIDKCNENKARRFCKDVEVDGSFCCYDQPESLLKAYSTDTKKMNEVNRKWLKYEQMEKKQSKSEVNLSKSSDKQLVNMKQTVTDKSGIPRAVTSSPVINDLKEDLQSSRNHAGPSDNKTQPFDSNQNLQAGVTTADGKYEFQSGQMKILVYKESITDIKGMDGIVNAANERMMHGGGVAYYISKAAGQKMNNECSEYIKKKGNLNVTENYVSQAGNMKCKGIIHAVGPQWHDYKGRQIDCAKDLYKTMVNCLEASKQRKWQRLALVAISSGIFGVPKLLCAEMYVKALVDYGAKDPGSMREVHFIDVSEEILQLVEKAHRDWVLNPNSISFDNALQYKDAQSMRDTKYKRGVRQTDRQDWALVEFIEDIRDRKIFKIAGILDLHVYTKSVLELIDVDAIVCSMDMQCNGVLLQTIIKAAGEKMEEDIARRQKELKQCKDGQVFLLPGGNLRVKNVISVTIGSQIQDTSSRNLESLQGYYKNIMEKAKEAKIYRLAMPMVGCGYIKDVKDVRSCCFHLINTITALCMDETDKGHQPYIKELHLVNFDKKFTKFLVEALQCAAMEGHDSNHPSSLQYDVPKFDPDKPHGWTLHKPLTKVSTKSQSVVVEKKASKPTLKSTMKTSLKKTVFGHCHYFSDCKEMAAKQLQCGHGFCNVCLVPMKSGCKVCQKEGSKSVKDTKHEDSMIGNMCPICFEKFKVLDSIPSCAHEVCEDCLHHIKTTNPVCPICNHIFGILTGNQPDGRMYYKTVDRGLPGYESHNTIVISYVFKDGIQGDNHPNPGRSYKGTNRIAYLPDNTEGKKVLHLLRIAFDRKLTFTVGQSRSTGKEDCVTYNDIHHKTSQTGGPTRFGYPDPGYLTRVQEELKSKGVTE